MVDFYNSIDVALGLKAEEGEEILPTSPVLPPSTASSVDPWETIDSSLGLIEPPPERRSGEGVGGFFGDVGAGLAGGTIRGAEMVAQSAEWFLPESMDEGAGQAADFLKGIREENPGWFGESRVSEAARESAWNPRGWFFGGMESLAMMGPGLAVGVVNPLAGAAVVGTQFWGSTAQDAYDEANANERMGIGEKLTESEKIVYANLRGFWEGGIEALQSRIPFAKLSKWIPKGVQGNIIRGAIKQPGNAAVNSIKSLAKTIGIEVVTELGQEYAGQETAFKYGQSEEGASWDSIKGVIGPTIIMSGILGIAGQTSEAGARKQLHDALTGVDVDPVTRAAAVKAMHDRLKDTDAELAQMWMDWAVPLLEENKPIALPLDEDVRTDAAADATVAKSALEEEIDSKQTEVTEQKAEIEARTAASSERAAEGLAEPQTEPQPNAEGVIEPELEEAPHTVESLDQAILTMERMIQSKPKSKAIGLLKENLTTAKAQRAKLLAANETAVDETQAEKPVTDETQAPAAEATPVVEKPGPVGAKPTPTAEVEAATPEAATAPEPIGAELESDLALVQDPKMFKGVEEADFEAVKNQKSEAADRVTETLQVSDTVKVGGEKHVIKKFRVRKGVREINLQVEGSKAKPYWTNSFDLLAPRPVYKGESVIPEIVRAEAAPEAAQPAPVSPEPKAAKKPAPTATKETPEVAPAAAEEAPAAPEASEEIKMLRSTLGEETVEEVTTKAPQAKTVVKVAEKFGKKVVFFKGSEKAHGVYHPSMPDVIFINLDADANPLMVTFGHELLHALKNDNVELYVKLARQLTGKTRNFRRWTEAQNKKRTDQGLEKATDAELLEELLADFTGEQFFNPEFWRNLLKKDKALFVKLSELFQQVYEQLSRFAPATNKYFKEIKEARAALNEVFEEYAAIQAAEQQAPVVEGAAPKLSIKEPTFKAANVTQGTLPPVITKLLPSKAEDGKYYKATAKSLSNFLDRYGDGFMYRVANRKGIVEGFDLGMSSYLHQFKDTKNKVFSFTSSLEDAREILDAAADPSLIVYKVKPSDVGEEFAAQIPSRGKNLIHIHSPVPAATAVAEVVHRNGEWVNEAGQNVGQGREAARREPGLRHDRGIGPEGKFSLKAQPVSQSSLGLYSALGEAVKGIDAKQMPAAHWLARLRKTQGVKADELQWTGVEEWLGAQDGRVSQDDLTAFIEANGVQVEEVVLGEAVEPWEFGTPEEQEAATSRYEAARNVTFELSTKDPGWDAAAQEQRDAEAAMKDIVPGWGRAEGKPDLPSKYSQYTLPGGENYREVLLTLPTGEGVPSKEFIAWAESKTEGLFKWNELTSTQQNNFMRRYRTEIGESPYEGQREPGQKEVFTTPHFDQPNIIAHIRLIDRVGPNGEKILFIEELQSDWAQEGRKKGFARELTSGERAEEAQLTKEKQAIFDEHDGMSGILRDQKTEARGRVQSINLRLKELVEIQGSTPSMGAVKGKAVPTAPFVGSTSKWLDLALKRVLRLAAEGGYDAVSWTPGEVQADRYDLSKQVDLIEMKRDFGFDRTVNIYKNGGGPIVGTLIFDTRDGEVIDGGEFPGEVEGKQLDEVVGKELAKKMISDAEGQAEGDSLDYEGEDLKVGGEGMKAFYDSIVPKAMGKLLRKLDKSAKVAPSAVTNAGEMGDELFEVVLPNGKVVAQRPTRKQAEATAASFDGAVVREIGDELEVLAAPVTKDLSDKVMEGQALFSLKTPEQVRKEVFKTDDDAAEAFTDRISNAVQTGLDREKRVEIADKLDAARTFLVDRYGPINKHLGEEVYKLHRMLNNSAATVGTFLKHGKLSWAGNALTVKTENEGFVPWFQSLGKEGHQFLYWVAAKRAEKLDAQDRENWFSAEQRNVLLDDAEKRGMTEKYEEWNKKLQEYNRNVVDIGIQVGLISKDARERWMSHYYLPFFRVLENEDTAEEFLKGPTNSKKYITSGIKTLGGGEAMIGDPLQNLMQNWTHIISESQRQIARQDASELMINAGMAKEMTKGDLIKVLGVNSIFGVRGLNEDGTINWSQFEEMTRDQVLSYIDKENRKRKKGDQLQLIERQTLRTANKEEGKVMSFMRNGKPVYVKVDDADLFQALTQIDSKNLDFGPIKVARWFKQLLTLGATFGVGFRIANLLRDTLHSAVVSKSFFPFVDSARGAMQVVRQSPDYIELMASGGGFAQGYLNSADPEALTKSIQKLIDKEGIGVRKRILDTPRKLYDFWQWVGHASEMAARVQLYTNLKAKGKTHMEAAFEARDLLDFALTGKSEAVRVLTAVTPFLNARMQGLDRLARGARDNPAAFALKGSMVAMASLALWAWAKDDDRYKELEDWDKWQYHHVFIGDQHIRIPKAFEVGAIFGTLFEAGAETMTDEEEFGYFIDMIAHTGRSTFNIGMPQIVSPLLEAWSNKSTFTGRQIEPEWMRKLSPGARANPWTSESLKEVGKLTGVSPVKLQNLIRGYTATIGTMVLTIADAVQETRDDVVTPQKMAHEYIGLDRFISTKAKNTKYATRYHEFAEEATQLASTISHYKNMQNHKMAQGLAEITPDYKARKKLVTKINKKLAGIRRREKMVWSNLSMDRATKREQLDQLREQKSDVYKAAYRQIKRSGF